MRWDELSMSDKSSLMRIYIKEGIKDISLMKRHFDSFQEPPSRPDFIKRLGNNKMETVPDKYAYPGFYAEGGHIGRCKR